MPHVTFTTGRISSTSEFGARQLVPGIEPGSKIRGLRKARRFRPAMVIRQAYVQLEDIVTPASADIGVAFVELKLSQEQDLTPGLLLPVSQFVVGSTSTANLIQTIMEERLGDFISGTVWVPRFVGVRVGITGSIEIDPTVHLDYDIIQVPWQDWFLMWEFLDNVRNNTREW
jgi:hypothetical protein